MTRGLLLWLAAFTSACSTPAPAPRTVNPAPAPTATAPGDRRVELRLFIMSKCPYAVQAARVVAKVMEEIGPAVQLRLYYIAEPDSAGVPRALHGPSEVKGNILQLCALERAPDRALTFINCQGRELDRIPDNWERCAEEARIPAEQLMACYTSDEGGRLLRESMERVRRAGVTGSPTILVAGRPYDGPRARIDLTRAVCDALGTPRPAGCDRLPAEVAVSLLVLNDKRCSQCKTEGMVATLRERFFPKLTVRHVDYGTEEGKRLYRELRLDGLPALAFDAAVERHHRHRYIERWLARRGNRHLLLIRPLFDPKAEICDNGIDDTGDGKADCADPDCVDTLACRKEQPRRLDLFVMSQCPFAAQGVLALREVLKNFGGKLSFRLHYIAEETDDGFRALHGAPEVAENIRQLCAKEHYGKNDLYLDYIWCRFADYRSEAWQRCAVKGISADVIERCASGQQGRRLFSKDIRLAKALGITASPTWLANNRHTFHGISAEQIKQGICRWNTGLGGCENTLSNESDTPAGSCGGN
ncbi:MAG: hypothetical protein JRI55_23995 [Deltaproteobacteria bacterium]|jgi:protein-disulfide isomerase|nr:hypothetical protein [Deltaproteobacteria bacterium]